jgi:hypothetical protein
VGINEVTSEESSPVDFSARPTILLAPEPTTYIKATEAGVGRTFLLDPHPATMARTNNNVVTINAFILSFPSSPKNQNTTGV